VKAAVTIDPVKLALSVPVAAITDPVVKVDPAIWTAKLRTDHVAIFPVNGSKIPNAAAAAASGVIVLAVAAVIASAVAVASVAVVALEVSAAEGGAADGNNLDLEFTSDFSYNQRTQSTNSNKTYEKTINTNKYCHRHRGIGTDNSLWDNRR
jgi:hypothetical protein